MKKFTLFSILLLFIAGEVSAQSITVTNATNCTPPCNGQAAATAGATSYVWSTTPTQTTATATGLCPGVYTLTATISTFTTIVATATVTCAAAVPEYELNKFIEVFPNPATENLSINFSYPNGGTVKEVSVFNSIGEKVVNQSFSSSAKFTNKLFAGNVPAGVYFMELKDEKNVYPAKFLKE